MGQQDVTPEEVVVTGASAGLGRATAVSFAKRGAYLGLLARVRGGLEGTKREVESAGGEALAIPTDLSNPDAVEAAAQQVEEKPGPMDVWVNNAMVSVFSPTEQMTPGEYSPTSPPLSPSSNTQSCLGNEEHAGTSPSFS